MGIVAHRTRHRSGPEPGSYTCGQRRRSEVLIHLWSRVALMIQPEASQSLDLPAQHLSAANHHSPESDCMSRPRHCLRTGRRELHGASRRR